MCKKVILIVCLAGISLGAIAQTIGVKTNLLYGGLTLTPNISVEIGVGEQSTLELGGGYNPWNLNGRTTDNKKLVLGLEKQNIATGYVRSLTDIF